MAVRNDFTAGEVLAAADLNDTFASKLPYSFGTATPSTTDSGFLWYDSNSTPAVAKYWDGSSFATLAPAPGLELITSETLSAVSSVSINNCFSADFQHYCAVIFVEGSANASLDFRMRAAGTDATGANYNTQVSRADGTTATLARAQNQTLGAIGPLQSGVLFGVLTLMNPFAVTATFATFVGGYNGSTPVLETRHTNHFLSTSYDGISFIPASGTLNGNIRIYGYRN